MIYIEHLSTPEGYAMVHRTTALPRAAIDLMRRSGVPLEQISQEKVALFVERLEQDEGLLGIAQMFIKFPGTTVVIRDHGGKLHTYFGYSEAVELVEEKQ